MRNLWSTSKKTNYKPSFKSQADRAKQAMWANERERILSFVLGALQEIYFGRPQAAERLLRENHINLEDYAVLVIEK